MNITKKLIPIALRGVLLGTAACGARHPVVTQPPVVRSARLEIARSVPTGGVAQIFDENVCITATVECTGLSDMGTQHPLVIPGRPCETQHADGHRWVHARGVTEVPWPCAGSGEVWVSGLLPDVGCHHLHERYAASSEHGDQISATVVLECTPETN